MAVNIVQGTLNVKLSTLQVPPQPPETRSGKQSEAEQT